MGGSFILGTNISSSDEAYNPTQIFVQNSGIRATIMNIANGVNVTANVPLQTTVPITTNTIFTDTQNRGGPITGQSTGYAGQNLAENQPGTNTNKTISTGSTPIVQEVTNFNLMNKDPRNPIPDNPLNGYILTQYHVAFSMVSQDTALRIQSGTTQNETFNVDQLQNTLKTDEVIVFASTGEEYRNTGIDGGITDPRGRKSNYYNIQSLELQTTFQPTQENPLISTMGVGTMTLVEPLGFKFHEDISRLAQTMGYTGVNKFRAVYRLDIYWSGFNQNTGQWVNGIPLSRDNPGFSVCTYYVTITGVDGEITPMGTVYRITLAPYAHAAYRPEEMVFAANTIILKEDTQTFGDFLKELETSLGTAKSQRTLGKINRTYKFFAPDFLRKAKFVYSDFGKEHGFISDDSTMTKLAIGKDITILDLIKAALSDLVEVQDAFINYDGNQGFLFPRIHFTVRFNIKYSGNPNNSIYDYDNIENQYIIEPFVTFKKGTVKEESVSQYVDRNNQITRIGTMLRAGMIERIYDYIFTGNNTDIISFDLKLKQFFYNALLDDYDTGKKAGPDSKEAASAIENDRTNTYASVMVQSTINPAASQKTAIEAFQLQNTADIPVSPFEVLGGGFNETPDRLYATSRSSDLRNTKNDYANYLDDHLANEFIVADLHVRGDPTWLSTMYSAKLVSDINLGSGNPTSPSSSTGSDQSGTVATYLQKDRIVFIRAKAPKQDDYMNPNRTSASSNTTYIGGFYTVQFVKSMFEGGKFTQTITATKMPHLNYVDTAIGVRTAPGSTTSGNQNSSTEPNPDSIGPIPLDPNGLPIFAPGA